jgi:hypothetical protein
MVRPLITSTLSMLASMAIAYGIDRWLVYQQRVARREMTYPSAYTWVIIGGLVLLLVWLVESWFILVKSQRTLAVSIIFIILGLLAFVWYPLELASPFWLMHFYLFPYPVDNLQYSGLFIAILGILTLIIPNPKSA